MNILLNDEKHTTSTALNLLELMEDLKLNEKKGVAAAVNEEVVPKQLWKQRKLCENDVVMVIKAIQGG